MTRTRRIFWLAVLLGVLGSGCGQAAGTPPQNLILIVVDTLRRDRISPYGADVATPHIAKLAERGVRIDAHASFHQTTMSMGALFTGRTPSIESGESSATVAWTAATWCGMGRFRGEEGPETCLPLSLATLGERVRERGYTTVGVCSNALLFRPAGFERGFDHWVEIGKVRQRTAELAAPTRTWEKVNAGVRKAITAVGADAPLFLYVHYLDVHDWRALGLGYEESVERLDAGIGDLLGLLEDAGRLEDAVIVFTSDHGERLGEIHVVKGFGDHLGNPSFGTLLDVPLIVVGADDLHLPPLVRSEDIHWLVSALAGGETDSVRDLAPDELLLSERTYRTFRRGRFKSYWSRGGGLALVDLETDPHETRDVASANPSVLDAHRARIEELSETLAAREIGPHEKTSDDIFDRLRALGYVE